MEPQELKLWMHLKNLEILVDVYRGQGDEVAAAEVERKAYQLTKQLAEIADAGGLQ